MTARRPGRPTVRLTAVAGAVRAQLRHRRHRHHAALALILVAGLGACAGTIAGAPALAAGESGGSPNESGSTGTSNCPSPNPPNQLTLVGGTPQTTVLNTAFASGLQVALSNSDGCAVTGAAGVPVTFSAPAAGAGGRFSASNANTVTVGADSSGSIAAPTFTANGSAGSYTVTASSQYGSVSFALTNAAVTVGVWCSTLDKRASPSAGEPVRLTPGVGSTQSTPAGARFPIRLAVTVTDAEGNPVPDTPVTFSAPAHGASGNFTIGSRAPHGHRHRVSHPHTVQVKTDACGIALAPPFTANRKRGGYIVKAAIKHVRPAAFALVNESP